MRAGLQVNWTSEKECFDTFLHELAQFNVPFSVTGEPPMNTAQQQWQIQHVLYPAFKSYLKPSNKLAKNGNITQIASLDRLYRVFERC